MKKGGDRPPITIITFSYVLNFYSVFSYELGKH